MVPFGIFPVPLRSYPAPSRSGPGSRCAALSPVAPRRRRTPRMRSMSWQLQMKKGLSECTIPKLKRPANTSLKAHSSAVFDLAGVPGEHRIVTVSGDQTAKVWDVQAGELLGACKGHQCSLKAVAFSRFEKAVFCTGGRDGNIMVWDTRCNQKDGFYRQVKQISGACNVVDKQTPSKPKKKRQNLRGLTALVDFQQSVTVVLLQDEHTLICAGAVDGVIKVWDLRKSYTAYRQDPLPCKSFCYPGTSTHKLG